MNLHGQVEFSGVFWSSTSIAARWLFALLLTGSQLESMRLTLSLQSQRMLLTLGVWGWTAGIALATCLPSMPLTKQLAFLIGKLS